MEPSLQPSNRPLDTTYTYSMDYSFYAMSYSFSLSIENDDYHIENRTIEPSLQPSNRPIDATYTTETPTSYPTRIPTPRPTKKVPVSVSISDLSRLEFVAACFYVLCIMVGIFLLYTGLFTLPVLVIIESYNVVALSYIWSKPEHPDPNGQQLRFLAP